MATAVERTVGQYYAVVRSGTGALGKPSWQIEMKGDPQHREQYDQYIVMRNSRNTVHLYIKGLPCTRRELQTIATNIDQQGGEYRQQM